MVLTFGKNNKGLFCGGHVLILGCSYFPRLTVYCKSQDHFPLLESQNDDAY